MIPFLRRFKEVVSNFPDRAAVVDLEGSRSTSYLDLNKYSDRVATYLRHLGIGKEDVVGIYFPKGMEYIAARIGVIKAGAAWVALEDMMGQERISYVVEDSGAKLVFDKWHWEKAMEEEPLSDTEWTESSLHDLAFIIYTSGSTGNPKGAVQEYGVYSYIMEGTFGMLGSYAKVKPLQFAHVLPESFVGGVYITIGLANVEGTIHVISQSMTRNPPQLLAYFKDHKIDTTFMTPTLINAVKKIPGFSLRCAYVGGEIVSNVFSTAFDVMNIYGPSEFGYPTCLFTLDKLYKNTPVGYPVGDTDICLLDDDGKEADEGLLCIQLPYSRGYMNLPEETASSIVKIEGKKFFKTKDFARRDTLLGKENCYTILGRADDMIKINGNRVEPAEVENAIKQVLHTDFATVRSFTHGTKVYLCGYYLKTNSLKPSEIEPANIAKALVPYLPEYMIPSYFFGIDAVPLNANGKVDKKALPLPEVKNERAPYSTPKSEVEKKLCSAYKNVLKVPFDVGLDDDFILLGGDSVSAVELIIKCRLASLNVPMIYMQRTPRRIAEHLAKVKETSHRVSSEQPLTMDQRYFFNYQQHYPQKLIYNLPICFHLLPSVDVEKLCRAVKSAMKAHAALATVIEKRNDGTYIQHVSETAVDTICVEYVPEAEIEARIEKFVKPFAFDGTPLFRAVILKSEKNSYALMDAHHIILDGFSYWVLLDDITRAYYGKTLEDDGYYRYIAAENEYEKTAGFKEEMALFDRRYKDCTTYSCTPEIDFSEPNQERNLEAEIQDHKDIIDFCTRNRISPNIFYIAACALALSEYNSSPDVLFTWTWNGRSDLETQHIAGLLFRDLPIAFHIEKGMPVSALVESAKEQVTFGITHGNVSYGMYGIYDTEDMLCFIYQEDLYDIEDIGIANRYYPIPLPDKGADNILNVEIRENAWSSSLFLNYDAGKYRSSSISRFSVLFQRACQILIKNEII